MTRQNTNLVKCDSQQVPHLWPGEDEGFQFARVHGHFSSNPLLDLGDNLAFVIGDLPPIGFVVPFVVHLARPEPVIEFLFNGKLVNNFTGRNEYKNPALFWRHGVSVVSPWYPHVWL